ncbi:hypothetical protein LTR09_000432 [Extremus antarcticus]|uniref:Uncharacterized protein n=1 Tax=Extremus antarcticus TaxID=702011 RepID=A0AAJ0GJL9_9PEZI|nr:hypothetical protein LTR09_000432 [Extremus antarcticus]
MPPKHAHQGKHQGQGHLQMSDLSEEDKQILRDAHKNHDNPDHPAHPKHPEHHSFLRSIPQRLGGAAIFGAGATVGSHVINSLMGH